MTHTVYWRDHDSAPEWASREDIKEWAEESYNDLCVSVGYIVERRKNYIVVAGEMDKHGNYGNRTMILRSAITKITKNRH